MNKYLLLTFCFALALGRLSAQKTLSTPVQAYVKQLPESVQTLLTKAGYKTTGAGMAAERSGPLQLDSTKTFYGYFTPADSTPLFRSVYAYPQPNVQVEVNSQFDFNQWYTLNRSTLHQDAQGRIVEALAEVYDIAADDFTPDSRLLSYPHGDSPDQVDSAFAYGWDPLAQDWYQLLATFNKFDAQGRLLENSSTLDINGELFFLKDVYIYDANGDNIRIESFVVFGGQEFPGGKREFTYVNHLPVEVIAYVFDGVTDVAQSRLTYVYNGNNLEVETKSYEWDFEAGDWLLTQTTTLDYDNANRLIERINVFHNNEEGDARERSTFAYVEGENLALESLYIGDDTPDGWILEDREYYYYSGLTATPFVPAPTQALTLAPNPTPGVARLDLTEEADVRVFNTDGQLLQTRRLQAGQSLDLTTLPPGVYQVIAQSEQQAYSGKVVKM